MRNSYIVFHCRFYLCKRIGLQQRILRSVRETWKRKLEIEDEASSDVIGFLRRVLLLHVVLCALDAHSMVLSTVLLGHIGCRWMNCLPWTLARMKPAKRSLINRCKFPMCAPLNCCRVHFVTQCHMTFPFVVCLSQKPLIVCFFMLWIIYTNKYTKRHCVCVCARATQKYRQSNRHRTIFCVHSFVSFSKQSVLVFFLLRSFIRAIRLCLCPANDKSLIICVRECMFFHVQLTGWFDIPLILTQNNIKKKQQQQQQWIALVFSRAYLLLWWACAHALLCELCAS